MSRVRVLKRDTTFDAYLHLVQIVHQPNTSLHQFAFLAHRLSARIALIILTSYPRAVRGELPGTYPNAASMVVAALNFTTRCRLQ